MGAAIAWVLSNPTILAIGAGIIAVAGAWIKGRVSGVAAERAKSAAADAKATTEGQKIDDAVAGRTPDANRERLGTWSKG